MKAYNAKMKGNESPSFQGAKLNVPQEELLLNMDHAHPGANLQGANLNVPQEEMVLDKVLLGGTSGEKPLGLGS